MFDLKSAKSFAVEVHSAKAVSPRLCTRFSGLLIPQEAALLFGLQEDKYGAFATAQHSFLVPPILINLLFQDLIDLHTEIYS